ncbi:MAG: hypothetical protein BWX74_00431 [Tenericutes bacterium ADurb.Bin087]|nr:MAG: hypothetical protein BWX74_00431 [Tenericutes bacterium ADurb.Bin087]
MSNLVGYGLIAGFVLVIGIMLLLKIYLQTYHQGKFWYIERPLKYLMILAPMFFMFAIGERWKFGENFLPSGNPDDLAWGPFHLAWLAVMIVAIIVVSSGVKADQENTKRYMFGRLNKIDFTVFQLGILLLSIEFYKQMIFLELYKGLNHYHWYGFPLQFCSIPLFLYPIVPFVKNKKIKEAFYSFIAIFNLIGGLSVMILATGVFTTYVSISIHTMMWHGTMVVVAIYLINAYKIGTKWRHYLGAVTVLFILMVIAQLTNVLFHYIGTKFPGPGDFDGFFISPWISRRNMPILGDIRVAMQEGGLPIAIIAIVFPYIYFVVFGLTGLLIYYLLHFIWKENGHSHHKEADVMINTNE